MNTGDVCMNQHTQHELPVEALDYPLPEGSIATRPVEPRDAARLMVIRRSSDTVEHRSVCDLPAYVDRHDAMVFNTTSVLPARLEARRRDSGGRVEGLFVHQDNEKRWRVMLRSNGRLRAGQRLDLMDQAGGATSYVLELVEQRGGQWIVRPIGDQDPLTVLDEVGRTPLPPYIRRARSGSDPGDELDRAWYQTVYADPASAGSVAAPTAGLHFTPRLLQQLTDKGVERIDVRLDVGPGTFKPIATARLSEHEMHFERYSVSPEAIEALRAAHEDANRRIIAVGTTTVRTLESLPSPLPRDCDGPITGETDLLIAPPYDFQLVDGLLTNFHLPRSTLLALVAALVGLERLKALYQQAVDRGYRFYSYGDAMLILP